MKPPFPEDILSAWHDREATPPEQAEALRRLESVENGEKAAAERELSELATLSAALRNLPSQPVPSDLTNLILQRISRSASAGNPDVGPHPLPILPEPGKRRSRWLTGMLPVGVCVLALVVMATLLNSPLSQTNSESEHLPSLASHDDSVNSDALVAGPANSDELLPALVHSSMNGARRSDIALPGHTPAEMAELPARPLAAGLSPPGQPSVSHYFRLYENPDQLEVGQVVDAIQRQGDQVAVIQLTVVDLNQGLENLEVLLARNNIPVRSAVDFTDSHFLDQNSDKGAEPTPTNEPDSETAAKRQEMLKRQQLEEQEVPVQLYAVYVETSGEQLQAALKDIQQQKMLDSLAVNAPESLLALTPTNRRRIQSLAHASPEELREGSHRKAVKKTVEKDSPTDPALTPIPAEPSPEPAASPTEPGPGVSKAIPQAPVQLKAGPKPNEPKPREKPTAEEQSPRPAPVPPPPAPAPAEFKAPQERQPAKPTTDETPGSPLRAHQFEDQASKLAPKKRLQIVFMVVPAPVQLAAPVPASPAPAAPVPAAPSPK